MTEENKESVSIAIFYSFIISLLAGVALLLCP